MNRDTFLSLAAHPVPIAGPEYYNSYRVSAPSRTHRRRATCEEYECAGYLYGFVTTVDLSTELGQRQYHFLTHDKKRKYHEQRVTLNLVKFIYGPGNICMNWDSHTVPIDRPPRLIVMGGDWRGNPRGTYRVHDRIEHWCEDFGENQIKLAEIHKRG